METVGATLGVVSDGEAQITLPNFRHLHEVTSAAAAELWIALVPKFFVERQVEQLGLVIPVDISSHADSAYYLVYPTELSHGKPLELFRA
ncbi:hypothetical protein DIE22_37275 [Burkholderia sp. Bp9142]|nr:hypothetical protein DIE22_37275 [Burkholderia sp. Bp9142]